MKQMILPIVLFIIGIVLLYVSGANGYWDTLTITGFIGIGFCLLAIASPFIIKKPLK